MGDAKHRLYGVALALTLALTLSLHPCSIRLPAALSVANLPERDTFRLHG